MNDPRHSLGHHVPLDTSDARVERLWAGVEARAPKASRRHARAAWSWGAAVGALAGALLLLRVVHGPWGGGASAWDGASLQTAADSLAVTLVDGSSVRLAPKSRVEMGERLPAAVKLVLKEGRLTCDVTHRPARTFVVEAADVEVRVMGTRFSVATSQVDGATQVEVQVERGVVEVRGPGSGAAPVQVEAGRTWSRITRTGALPSEAATRAPVPSVIGGAAAPTAAAPTAAAPAPSAAPELSPAPTVVPSKRGGALKPSAEPMSRKEDARRLFERAREAWRAGRIEDAAAAYEALLVRSPHDARAGLAAFELGRLRMDRLGDMAGAARALERAVALAPSAELREDALARLVAARGGARDQAGCARARDAYLARYPTGVHRSRVVAACAAP